MNALEKIFQGYYEDRVENNCGETEGMKKAIDTVRKKVRWADDPDDLMSDICIYGMESEKAGFMVGFQMAWELWENMKKGGEAKLVK